MNMLYARRRRPTFFIFAALVIFGFFYTFNRLLFSASSSGIPSPPIPVANTNPGGDSGSGDGRPNQEPPKDGGSNGQEEGGEGEDEVDDMIPMDYGTASRPNFDGLGELKKISKLPEQHLPNPTSNKRLIIVGDVHGMIDPLQSLLGQLGYDADGGDDHLVFVGDMVSDGPDSAAVVELARFLGASGVRGVREDRVLLARGDLNSTTAAAAAAAAAQDDLEQQHLSHGDYDDRLVAESLSDAHVDYLAGLPVILELGPIPTLGNAFVAHAGLVPGLEIAKQDPWPAMHMRSVVYPRVAARRKKAEDKVNDMVKENAEKENEEKEKEEGGEEGGEESPSLISQAAKEALVEEEFERTSRPRDRDLVLPVSDYSGEDWAGAWDEVEARVEDKDDRRTVFYGHDTKRGLHVGQHAIGLNTECVYGGKLTAFVIRGTAGVIQQEVVQVDCKEEAKRVDERE